MIEGRVRTQGTFERMVSKAGTGVGPEMSG